MCDFNAVLAWVIAAMVALGGAISSVIFGLVYPLWATAAFWAAAGWCGVTLGFAFAAAEALRTFCNCASASSACAGPCSMLRTLMGMFIADMFVAIGLCIATASSGWNPWFAALFLFEAAIVTGIAFAIIVNLVSLSSCIARSTPPTPPTPPDGTGAGAAGAPPI